MIWKPEPDKDSAVRAWLSAKGLTVEDTEYDARQQVYLWIHNPPRGTALVLGIAREVVTETPLFIIQELHDRRNVAAELKARPGVARVLVRRNDEYLLEDFVRK